MAEGVQERIEAASVAQTGVFEPEILAFCCEH